MNRKKITTIAACLIMALSLTACGSQTSQPGQEGQSSQPAQNTQTADSSSVTEQDPVSYTHLDVYKRQP